MEPDHSANIERFARQLLGGLLGDLFRVVRLLELFAVLCEQLFYYCAQNNCGDSAAA